VITRDQGDHLADELHGARVIAVERVAGVLVLELGHRGTDDGTWRLAINLSGIEADPWPWPQ
jgi:hypothetical protein